jgi:farnesyl-diphosphate farnesyltransferase
MASTKNILTLRRPRSGRLEGRTAAIQREDGAESVETPSGKWRGGENFPVGSFLIQRGLRVHVHAFYRFARNADDIADNPALTADEKIGRLDRMAAILDGAPSKDSPAASAMRESLLETGVTAQHCHDVLHAFRLDAVKLRYRDWNDLMGYCRYSASPVGRQLLDLHGESRATWPASDALCSALQVLNHLQDCVDDHRLLDRVYLPLEDLAADGIGVEAVAAGVSSPGLRRVLDRLLDRTAALIDQAGGLPPLVTSRGLRWESAVIVALAGRLLRRLRHRDPVAAPVALSKADFVAAFAVGVSRGFRG